MLTKKLYYHPPFFLSTFNGKKQLVPLEKHMSLRYLGLGTDKTIPDITLSIIIYEKASVFNFVF